MSGIPDWVISALIAGFFGFFFTLIYFFSFYLGRHPARAILELRENRENDQWQLDQARALLHGMDYIYQWPKGFDKCRASDSGEHLGAGPYPDGAFECYWCGSIATPIKKEQSK